MKKKDWNVLAHLRQNARMPLTLLSKKTGVPISTLFDSIKRKTQTNMIRPSMLLNFDKIGFPTRAHILISVSKQQKQKLLDKLNNSCHVNSLYTINNGWDVLMECVFKEMRLLEEFVDDLEAEFEITSKEIHYVLEERKREAFLSDPSIIDLVLPQAATFK